MARKSENVIKESVDALKASTDLHLRDLKDSLQSHFTELLKGIVINLVVYLVVAITSLYLLYRGIIFLLSFTAIPASEYGILISGVAFLTATTVILFRSLVSSENSDLDKKKQDELKRVAIFNRDVKQKVSNFKYGILHPFTFIKNKFREYFLATVGAKELDWFKVTGLVVAIGGAAYFISNWMKEKPSNSTKKDLTSKASSDSTVNKNQLLIAVKGLLVAAVTSLIKEFLTELFTQRKKPSGGDTDNFSEKNNEGKLRDLQEGFQTAH